MPIRCILAGILLLAAAGAEAQIREFNAGCVAAGCFPGDSPGFPVEILRPGHYRLTSIINNPDPNTDTVYIHASDVTLDLNGLTLMGPNECRIVRDAVECRYDSGGELIWVHPDSDRVRIFDGYLRGAAGNGLLVGYSVPLFPVTAVEIQGLTVSHSGAYGVACNCRTGTVKRSHALLNRYSGFLGNNYRVMYLESHARLNGIDGFSYGVCRETVSSNNLGNNYESCELLGPVVDDFSVISP